MTYRDINRIRAYILTLIVFALPLSSHSMDGSQANPENDWIMSDIAFIKSVVFTISLDPESIINTLAIEKEKRIDLGYGYSFASDIMGKGYMSFEYTYIFHFNELISFRIWPLPSRLARNRHITKRYIDLLKHVFPINTSGDTPTPFPYYYNLKLASSPIDNMVGHLDINNDSEIAFLMTPYSGIQYGYYSSMGNLTYHRKSFNKIKDRIDSQTLITLLYSMNPATRLTAYEHYLLYKHLYTDVSERVEKRGHEILNEPLTITTSIGCISDEDSPRRVLEKMLSIQCAKDDNYNCPHPEKTMEEMKKHVRHLPPEETEKP